MRNFYLRGALIGLAEVLVVKNGKNELLILVQVLMNHPPHPHQQKNWGPVSIQPKNKRIFTTTTTNSERKHHIAHHRKHHEI